MKISKQAYTIEFKELAVKRINDGQSVSLVSKELCLSDQTLRIWVKASAAGKLGEAQRQSEEYLKGVSDVLAGAHESFAKHVGDTMRVANAGFQKELRTAVDMVSAAVRDLSDTLEDMPGRGR